MTLDSVIPRIAGITPQSSIAAVLNERATVLDLSERTHGALLAPRDPGGLSVPLRAALAVRVASINHDKALIGHYRGLLDEAEGGSPGVLTVADPDHVPSAESAPRLAAIVRHADLLAITPQDASKDAIEALQTAGVADADIVRLTQLIGFVTYQVRFATGLRLVSG